MISPKGSIGRVFGVLLDVALVLVDVLAGTHLVPSAEVNQRRYLYPLSAAGRIVEFVLI